MLTSEVDVDCVTAVISGIAPDRIVEYATENHIVLIVMGKPERSGPDTPTMGSITGRVIDLTDVPFTPSDRRLRR